MSQIRKFNKGGETAAHTNSDSSNVKTYGKFNNGQDIEVTDQFLKNLALSGSNNDFTGAVYADIADTLREGTDVTYDPSTNRIYGVKWKRVDPKIIDRINKTQSWNKKSQRISQRWANKNTPEYQLNSAIASIGRMQVLAPENKKDEEKISKISLFGEYGPFEYNKENGKNVWAESPLNANALNQLDIYSKLGSLNKEEAFKKYDMDEDKYNLFMNWYNTYGNNYNWNDLINRIKEQKFNSNDDELLNLLGWNISTESPENNLNPSRSYEGSGFDNKLLEKYGYYVRKDENGNTFLYDNQGNLVTQNIYLKNSPWSKGTQWDGGAVYQGQLYTPEQIFNQNTDAKQAIGSQLFDKIQNLSDPNEIREAIRNSEWLTYGTENPYSYATFDSNKNYLKGFEDVLKNGIYYWNDITRKYQIPEGKDIHILSVLNAKNRDRDNTLRTQYAVSGYDQLFNTIEELQNYLNSKGIKEYQGYKSYTPIQQYQYIKDANGNTYIISPKKLDIAGNEYNLYRDLNGNYYTDGNNGEMRLLLGKNIMEAIKNDNLTAQMLLDGFAKVEDKPFFQSQRKANENDPYESGSYDQFLGFRKGGKIPIMQMGGYFSQGRVRDNNEVTISNNRVGTSQKLGADKKLITNVDTLNKTAGVLDIAGLATSGIPILGTAVGILGSLARFSADVKKDGFQWKDAGNLAANLGLDALTLIPGLGVVGKVAKTGSKAAKLAKSSNKATKIARSITPIMSAAGAGTGAVQIAEALNNPDGMTSEDFGNLLSGITNVGLGSKNLIKNYKTAKIVKSLAKDKPSKTKELFKVKENDTKFTKAAKKIGNWGNNTIHLPGRKIKEGTSTLNYMFNPFIQTKNSEIIANNWKTLAKSNNIFSNRLAAEYLNKNRLNTKKRTIDDKVYNGINKNSNWFNPKYELTTKNVKSNLKFDTNAEKLVQEILSGNVKTEDDILNYISNKIPINKQEEILNLITNKEELKKLFKKTAKKLNILDYSKVVETLPENLRFKKGGKIIKGQAGLKPGDLVFNNNNSKAYDWINKNLNLIIYDDNGNVDWEKTYDKNSGFSNWRNVYINNWDEDWFQQYKQKYLDQLSKGNPNTTINNYSLSDFKKYTDDKKLGYAHNLDIFNENEKTDILSHVLPSSISLIPDTTSKIISDVEQKSDTKKLNQNLNVNGDGAPLLSPKLKMSKWNPDLLIGGLELIRSVGMNNLMFNKLKNANKAVYKPMPEEIYDRYQDHITPIAQETAKEKRTFIPTSTDATLNYSMRQANEDWVQQWLAKNKLTESENYSKYLNDNLAARRNYSEQRMANSFFNNQQRLSKIFRDAELEQGRMLSNNQSIANAVLEFRNKLNTDRQKRLDLLQQDTQLLAQNAYDEKLRTIGQKYFNDFNNLDLETQKQYNNIGGWQGYWQEQNLSNYNDAVKSAMEEYRNVSNQYKPYMLDYYRYKPIKTSTPQSLVIQSKKGGKTNSYIQRHNGPKPDEAIWIQRNKDVAKALEKLHDAVIKLLMQNIS